MGWSLLQWGWGSRFPLSFLLDPKTSGAGMVAGTQKVNPTYVGLFSELLQEALKPSTGNELLEQLWGMSPPSFLSLPVCL